MESKCFAAGVNAAVATQLLASLDFERVRNEGKTLTVLTVGETSVSVELGKEYFFDAQAAVRESGAKDLAWAL